VTLSTYYLDESVIDVSHNTYNMFNSPRMRRSVGARLPVVRRRSAGLKGECSDSVKAGQIGE